MTLNSSYTGYEVAILDSGGGLSAIDAENLTTRNLVSNITFVSDTPLNRIDQHI